MVLKTNTNFSKNSGANYVRLPKEIFDDSLFSQLFSLEDELVIELIDDKLVIYKEENNEKKNH